MCLYPTFVKNKKYTATKKNGGIIPVIYDIRTIYVPIGCQNCSECRTQKAREWQVRLMEDIKTHTNGKFITLTFSDKNMRKWHDKIQTEIDDAIDKLKKGRNWGNEEIRKIEKLNKMRTGYELDNQIATRAMRMFNERWRKKHKHAIRHWTIS